MKERVCQISQGDCLAKPGVFTHINIYIPRHGRAGKSSLATKPRLFPSCKKPYLPQYVTCIHLSQITKKDMSPMYKYGMENHI